MTHSVFAIVAPVARDRLRDLQAWLDPHDRATTTIPGLPLHDLDTVHFASVVAFPPPAGDGIPEDLAGTLVFECCVDGPIDEYLDTLVHVGAGTLVDLFSRCLDYRPGTAKPEAYLREYLASHVRKPQLYHIGTPRMPAAQIASGAALRSALDRALDQIVALGRAHDGAREIVERLRHRLRVPPSSEDHWHLAPESVEGERYAWYADPAFPWTSRLRPWAQLAAVVLLPLLLIGWAVYAGHGRRVLIGLALMLAVAWAFWRWLTGRHPPAVVDPTALNRLTEREDLGVLNHMASLAPLKPGLPRRVALHAVLGAFSLFYRTFFTDITPGRLAGLPTIHFAQWTVVPCFDREGHPTRHRALLFLSNYDGSWETYLDDFLANLMHGVVAIWANTTGFPWPLDGPTFKRWARTRMTPWQVWHQHACYRELTVQNIQNNDRIREGLLDVPASDHAARLWLARFGALQTGVGAFEDETFEETRRLEESDIQGLVLSGFAGLEEAGYVLLRMADTPEGLSATRRWLQCEVLPHVTSARERSADERRAEAVAVNVAFTWRGLHALRLDPSALGQFPPAFREGMAPVGLTHRSRILGDTGASRPEAWAWGGPDRPVDILLMVFARRECLDGFVTRLVGAFEDSGAGTKVDVIRGHMMRADGPEPAFVEHFGFRDGLSDPVLEGSWRARRQPASMHLLKPGEFLLGYPCADGTTAPGIAVDARADPDHVLPPGADGSASRDFGRNGTYLVCRQLSQDVAAFRRALEEGANAPCDSAAAEALAARVVGRWRNGTPIHVPRAERGSGSNEFGFADDPQGFSCPIGAHIRRANPRDSLGPDAASALRSASRHRLLRRGRPYGPPLPPGRTSDDGTPRGLVFLCLNGDIERQFEFVQQNWINNVAFGGLYDEADPLIGGGRDPRFLTVQASSVRQRINGLGRFVTVRGGQYFFLPGLSALRYLASPLAPPIASVVPAGDLLRQPIAAPAARRPSRLHAALTVVDAILPWLRMAWAVRVPLVLMAALVLVALAPRLSPSVAPTLFLTEGPHGVFAVALLASLAAFVAMITLRIVLLYGERLGLGRARWQGPARWAPVLAFQALAVPVSWEVIEQTARDRNAAGLGTWWASVVDLAPAAAFGFVAGLACLWIATALQALKPGAQPELFFPPNPLARRIGLRGARIAPPRLIARLVAATAQWIVDGVPPGIGAGYIDYRRRRLHSGHVFALSLALVVLALYVTGYFALHPEREGAPWNLPPVAYLLFVLIAACWLLSGLTFFFDRYHVPTIAVLAVWLAAVAGLARTDHYFPVSGPVDPAPTPAVMMARAEALAPDAPVVVVAAEGLGLVSSAWTAEVLTRLTESFGERFTRSLRMISAASGASLGTVYFVDEYTDAGFGGDRLPGEMAALLATVRARARASSSAEGAWGLAYPDLVRQFAPVFVPRRMDRDWARESAWRRALDGGPEPTLSAWRRDVAAGWRPAVAFGVTVVESGERGVLATYESPAPVRDVTASRDISMLTAARLSAAFPVISAAARPDTPAPAAFHLTDGGYWDNSGIVSAIEWLEAAQPTRKDRVVFIEIRSSPPRAAHVPENASWLLTLTAPLRTLVGVRYEGQPYRNASALDTYRALWRQRHGTELPHVVFDLKDDRLPLTWNLGHAAAARFTDAWRRSDVQAQAEVLRALLDAAW